MFWQILIYGLKMSISFSKHRQTPGDANVLPLTTVMETFDLS